MEKNQEKLLAAGTLLSQYIQNPKPYTTRVLRGGKRTAYLEQFANQPLSFLQKSFITGHLLGDGCILYTDGITPFLKIDQQVSQKAYIDVIYSVFEEYVGSPPSLRRDRMGNPHSYYFRTLRTEKLANYAKQFYQLNAMGRRTKVVPQNIHKWLNPISLAVWFMDDGGTEVSGYRLHTENFLLSDVKILQQALGSVFNLQANVRRDNRTTGTLYYLSIPANSKQRFQEIVAPYMVPTMMYKLRLPDTES
uniref:Putative site-specific DNA endonuclease n=1 Tax=Monomastix sp. (strain OKE-1) TaxID=141716 RepID=C0JWR5_MONSK|nr:putative site-specific DNA endonuclease [Monomastix sp. OKE-1]ACK36929.1 putative site-specific DNA endonuclease [Monomastix sp. OKE-1]